VCHPYWTKLVIMKRFLSMKLHLQFLCQNSSISEGAPNSISAHALRLRRAIACFVELEHINFDIHIEVEDDYESIGESLRMTIRLPSMMISYSEVFALRRRPPSSSRRTYRQTMFNERLRFGGRRIQDQVCCSCWNHCRPPCTSD
jgi:hypothetical protein